MEVSYTVVTGRKGYCRIIWEILQTAKIRPAGVATVFQREEACSGKECRLHFLLGESNAPKSPLDVLYRTDKS